MSSRTTTLLAWIIWAVCLMLAGLVVIAVAFAPSLSPEVRFPFEEFTAAVTFPTVGALIATRRSRNPIGWIFCAIGLAHTLSIFGSYSVLLMISAHPNVVPFARRLAWIATWA